MRHFKLRWLIAMIAVAAVIIYWLPDALQKPINHIKINARYQHIRPQEIQDVVVPLINKGFFTVNVAKIQNEVKKLPWVSQVGVRRVWPDTIQISIKEHKALARWKAGGIFNDQNKLFHPDPDSVPQDLPILSGPMTLASKICKSYQKMNPLFEKHQLNIRAIDVSDRRSWSLLLDNEVEIVLGKEHLFDRVERLMEVWGELSKKHKSKIKRVDLRYPNGFAVL